MQQFKVDKVKDWQEEKLSPTMIVIFGITGDLSHRKLLPALYYLIKNNLLPPNTNIVGVSRHEVDIDELMVSVRQTLSQNNQDCDEVAISRFAQMLKMYKMNLTSVEDYKTLKSNLDKIENELGVCVNRLFYLAIPPTVLSHIVKNLGESGLANGCQHGVANSRILLEKPFGFDTQSAKELIETNAKYFTESQIFRIDHYVAKETVQNILSFRFENPIFKDLWNSDHISHVEIIASEKIGIEGRAIFYEQTGALRDLAQSHLLQLLATVAMEEPKSMTSSDIHTSKNNLLKNIKPFSPDSINAQAVRGQYEGYKEEVNTPNSFVETYAGLKLNIDNARWRDVPFYIKTGKALKEKNTQVHIHFKPKDVNDGRTNDLFINIQPNEGIELTLWAKRPGFESQLNKVNMSFLYNQAYDEYGHPNAYERVLIDAIKGDQSLFASSEEVLASWELLEPVIKKWESVGDGLNIYKKGSTGPDLPESWHSS